MQERKLRLTPPKPGAHLLLPGLLPLQNIAACSLRQGLGHQDKTGTWEKLWLLGVCTHPCTHSTQHTQHLHVEMQYATHSTRLCTHTCTCTTQCNT
jgi:hypothetical protein